MESEARQGDVVAQAELAAIPKCPPRGAYLWNYYREIAADRPSDGMSLSRIPRSVIHDWEGDEGVVLERWERRLIRAIDEAWITVMTSDD